MKLSKKQFDALVADAPRFTVPYNKLVLSSTYQVRPPNSTPQLTLDELAASIKAVGQLQNLIVVVRRPGRYEVCGGGRRWTAMGQLVAAGDWPENYPVSVLRVPAEQALLVSLAENRHQVPMHPADEFEAFAKLIAQGSSQEEVAACFGVTPLVVARRMKLAHVAPALIALYREDQIGLEHLMALASVDDHQRQLQAWAALPEWSRRPEQLRALLTQDETSSNHPLVRLVTLHAYEQAGGAVRQDLFSDEGIVYLQDRVLLERLAHELLATTAGQLQADGWGWVETQLRYDYNLYGKHGQVRPQQRELSPEEQQRWAVREERLSELAEQVEAGELDDPDYQPLTEAFETLQAEQDADQQRRQVWPEEVKAGAGCVVYLSHEGKVEIKEGLIRPGAPASARQSTADPLEERSDSLINDVPPRVVHSKELMRCLTAHRVAAVQAELLNRPNVALVVLTAQLTQQVFARHDYRYSHANQPLAIQLTDSHYDVQSALEHSAHRPAFEAVEAAYTCWQSVLPEDLSLDTLVPWLLLQTEEQVRKLLAFLVARSVTGIQSSETRHHGCDVVATTLTLDMTQWWQATADSYFKHVAKRRMVEVVTEAVDAQAACPLEGMKKELCALRAEQLVEGRSWLPECLRHQA